MMIYLFILMLNLKKELLQMVQIQNNLKVKKFIKISLYTVVLEVGMCTGHILERQAKGVF